MDKILANLEGFDEVIVYDNSVREDLGIYARYAAMAECRNDVIGTQDDDMEVLDWDRLVAAYRPGIIAVNEQVRWEHETYLAWVGRGAVFDRALPVLAHARAREAGVEFDRVFTHMTCDIYFTVPTPFRRVRGNAVDLPYAYDKGRVWTTPGWPEHRSVAIDRALELRDEVLLNLGCGGYPLEGMENRDALTGWRFEDGLPEHADCSVAGITISHALMYLPEERWPAFFRECGRVLRGGGVLRVTEDSTGDPASPRFGGYFDAVTLTTPELVIAHAEEAGMVCWRVNEKETLFRDGRLIQNRHDGEPKAFFVECVMP